MASEVSLIVLDCPFETWMNDRLYASSLSSKMTRTGVDGTGTDVAAAEALVSMGAGAPAEARESAEVVSDEDQDGEEDTWRALFDLDARGHLMPQGEWVSRAKHVVCLLKTRAIKHVHWWNRNTINPSNDDVYPLPHLTLQHDSAVHTFRVDENHSLALATFLEDGRNYSDAGWLMLAGQ